MKNILAALLFFSALFCYAAQSDSQYNMFYNYCTYGYTFSYWTQEEWGPEIDRLAAANATHALVLPGHEKVWQNTLRRLNIPDTEIAAFIPGLPFAPWWLMANLEGHGGPISQAVIDQQAEIGRFICDRMREKKIEPLVNGFFGMMPRCSPKYIPGHYIEQGDWSALPRPTVLSPLDPQFEKIAQIYYEETFKVFGPVRCFGGDLFHEGGRTGNLPLPDCARAIEKAMQKACPNALYVLQGWQSNPKEGILKGLNPETTIIQALVLGFPAAAEPSRLRSFGAFKWVLCPVNNFGGNHGLYGNLPLQSRLPEMYLKNTALSCVGFGILDEGFERNPAVDALWNDVMVTRENVDLDAFIARYTQQRYGKNAPCFKRAFEALLKDLYTCPTAQEGVTDYVMAAAPSWDNKRARYWCSNNAKWSTQDVKTAVEELLSYKGKVTPGLRYDLIDFTRQYLNGRSYELRNEMTQAFRAKDSQLFDEKARAFLSCFDAMDELLACDTHFMLGTDLQRVNKWNTTDAEKAQMRQALRYLYTTWNNDAASLNDYASRSLNGLVGTYYKARWSAFINAACEALKRGDDRVIAAPEQPLWYQRDTSYLTKPAAHVRAKCKKALKI